MQVLLPVERVSGRAGKIRLQLPSFIQHMRVNHADRDQVLQSFQMAEDKRAMSPRARIGHIEMEPARLGFDGVLSIRAGRAIRRDPVAEDGIFAVELAVISGEFVFLFPRSVHQQVQASSSSFSYPFPLSQRLAGRVVASRFRLGKIGARQSLTGGVGISTAAIGTQLRASCSLWCSSAPKRPRLRGWNVQIYLRHCCPLVRCGHPVCRERLAEHPSVRARGYRGLPDHCNRPVGVCLLCRVHPRVPAWCRA